MTKFFSNTILSGITSISKVVLQLIMLPIMARLLSPTDYGLYALALPVIVFFVILADGGLGLSLSREEESNDLIWSTAFWLLIFVCLVMAIGVICSGFFLAWLSKERSLIGIMCLLSLNLPILAFMVPADARLTRRGNLAYHSISDLFGAFIGAGVAVGLAYHGSGAWSLAAQYVVSFAVRAIILNAAGWVRPKFIFDLKALKNHLSVASAIVISKVAELIGKIFENYLFGIIFQIRILGMYNMSNQVSQFTCGSVTNPLISSFYAHILHSNESDAVKVHSYIVRMLIILFLPMIMFLSVVAKEAFIFVLGEKWADAAVFFQFIAVPYCVLSISWFSLQILYKYGIVKKVTLVNVLFCVCRVGVVGFGIFVSSELVACFIGFSYLLQALISMNIVPSNLGANLSSLIHDTWRPMLMALMSTLMSYYLQYYLGAGLLSSSIAFICASISYVLLLYVFCWKIVRPDISSLFYAIRKRHYNN